MFRYRHINHTLHHLQTDILCYLHRIMDILNGPCEQLNYCLEEINTLADVIGMKILHADYTPNNPTLKFVACLMVFFLYVTYHTFLEVGGDFVATALCLVTFGVYSQVRKY